MAVATGLVIAGRPVRHNGGTLFGAQVSGSGLMNNDVDLGDPRGAIFASTVVSGVNTGSQKANTSRNFATQGAREYIIAGGATTTLGGVTTSVLKQYGSSQRDMLNVNLRTTRRTTHIQGWDYLTGDPTGTTLTTVDNFGTDNEATSIGRADAGNITSLNKGSNPVNYDYNLKTN